MRRLEKLALDQHTSSKTGSGEGEFIESWLFSCRVPKIPAVCLHLLEVFPTFLFMFIYAEFYRTVIYIDSLSKLRRS